MREMKKQGKGTAPVAPATALTMLCLAMLALPGMARAQDAVPAAAWACATTGRHGVRTWPWPGAP